MAAASLKPVSFVTFGMFIIDQIEWQTPNPPPPKHNLIGGAGTYAVLGARLASSPCQLLSRSISWIVDVGSDFPPEIRKDIDSWNTDCVYRPDASRLTTRAWNGYGEDEFRSFKYLTPKVRLEVESLNYRQLQSKSFHMVCSPSRCLDITTKLKQARSHLDTHPQVSPVIVWEPIPDLCSPEELARLHQAAAQCTVVSPNHDELKMFFSQDIVDEESQPQLAARLMGSTPAQRGPGASLPVLIVREGANGSTAYVSRSRAGQRFTTIHLPAYHTQTMSSSVIDPTGGGNTYLGALAIAMTDALYGQPTYERICKALGVEKPVTGTRSDGTLPQLTPQHLVHTVTVAMIYATIAASLAIEQNGTPHLEQKKIFTEIFEYWNGEKTIDRLQRYLDRERTGLRAQLADLDL